MNSCRITVIGAGLAGSEAAYRLAGLGYSVTLIEMRPVETTEAHKTDGFAELVCSNSLKSKDKLTSSGLLKYELEKLNSLLIKSAYECSVPAGSALAIDREQFSEKITSIISNHKNITVEITECSEIDFNTPTIIATGPLTSSKLVEKIKIITGDHLYFADAISPIIDADSIDLDKGYFLGRYGKGGDDYFNLPMSKEQYKLFYDALINAEYTDYHEFENIKYFEGCMPIEEIARRGKDTLLFGPLKPVGLEDPKTGIIPHAVMQLRKENILATSYNIVGFQTKMNISSQEKVFRSIAGLENAKFLRYGSMHRNTYINSPKILNSNFQCKEYKNIFFAGQITGVEGYVESIASGLIAALQLDRYLNSKEEISFSDATALGALSNHISGKLELSFDRKKRYTPSNFHFGLLPEFPKKIRDKKAKQEAIFNRSSAYIDELKI